MQRPSTISITCCSCPAAKIDASIRKIFNATEGNCWHFWRASIESEPIYKTAPPPGGVLLKYAVWEPANKAGYACLMTNRQDGGATIVQNISRVDELNLIRVFVSADSVEHPMYSFSWYEDGKEGRHIHSLLDGNRWEFYESGNPLPVEKLESYKKRNVRERFGKNHVYQYLEALDWRIGEDNFWHSSKSAFFGQQLAYSAGQNSLALGTQ